MNTKSKLKTTKIFTIAVIDDILHASYAYS
jgi:hypothetical protein